ncbi:hypothetical protein COV22_02850, partial [Candidatus Woesearchaeota archaeon CG10_big_fil_rev_8_21_14_0_10_47_5]
MIDFSKIKTYSIKNRNNKVDAKDFYNNKRKSFSDRLPSILAANDLNNLVMDLKSAAKGKKQVIVMMGGHVIKCGVSPCILELMQEGMITHVAMNGAGSIHDFEIALIGKTSEDVAAAIDNGSFGMAEETGSLINKAVSESPDIGHGAALGRFITEKKLWYMHLSILARAYQLKIPATVHVAIGTDITHQHPSCDGAAIGRATYQDFKILTESVSKLEGGVIINIGSAVLLPEVFLKALTIVRNLGFEVRNFTAAAFDMMHQYRVA